jgi:hypothetical protein
MSVRQHQETRYRHIISILIDLKSQKCLCQIKGYDLQSKIDMVKYKRAATNTEDTNLNDK